VQSSASVYQILRAIDRGPRPALTDEQALVERARRGDRAAVDRLTSANLAYVVRVAKEFRGRGVPFEDLIAEGCLGLLKAIRRYRASSGTRFMTYASFWVRKEILAAVTEQPNAIHVPRYAREHGHGSIRIMPIDVPEGIVVGERVPHTGPQPVETVIGDQLGRRMRRHVVRLPFREQAVIAWRFGLLGDAPKTLQEIARSLGLSKERVRQIEVSALAGLRRALAGRPADLASYSDFTSA
jgi:RNA polymerase primary sigma factor